MVYTNPSYFCSWYRIGYGIKTLPNAMATPCPRICTIPIHRPCGRYDLGRAFEDSFMLALQTCIAWGNSNLAGSNIERRLSAQLAKRPAKVCVCVCVCARTRACMCVRARVCVNSEFIYCLQSHPTQTE